MNNEIEEKGVRIPETDTSFVAVPKKYGRGSISALFVFTVCLWGLSVSLAFTLLIDCSEGHQWAAHITMCVLEGLFLLVSVCMFFFFLQDTDVTGKKTKKSQ